MRARLLFMSVVCTLALVACGGDDDGDGGKQTKVSSEAYPAVAKFMAAGANINAPLCTRLERVADEDKVAAVTQTACDRAVVVTNAFRRLPAAVAGCGRNSDCIADKVEPQARTFLTGIRDLATSYNRGLQDALEPGDCLEALTLPKSDIANIEAALDRLPTTMKRLRAGNTGALAELIQGDFSGNRNPKPCKT